MKVKNKEVLDVLKGLNLVYRVYFDKREDRGGAYYTAPVYGLTEEQKTRLDELGKKYKVVVKKGCAFSGQISLLRAELGLNPINVYRVNVYI